LIGQSIIVAIEGFYFWKMADWAKASREAVERMDEE
jgi:MATE family multidrug resistance protein